MNSIVAPNAERLSGSIERVTFHSEATGFCVLRVKVKGQRDLVTVVGSAASVTAGEFIECLGAWANDRQHGLQFKATELKTVQPTTLEGIEKYLGSGIVKGIGPHFAKKLVKAFGIDVFDVIEQTPERRRSCPASAKSARSASHRPGQSRKPSARSWCSCSRTASARPARCASTEPTATRPSLRSGKIRTG